MDHVSSSPNKKLRALPPPIPSAGMEAYNSERKKALWRSPKRFWNYWKYTQSNKRSTALNYLPIKLDIENVSRCNFKCTMCQVSDWDKGKRSDDLSISDFKKLVDEQYGLVEIKLQGVGEPTLQGDDFFEMIRYARRKNIWVRTTTNASLLHLNDNYKKLVDSDANEIQISVDGADKETFERIRRGSIFEQVAENCREINAYCREKNVRRTKMWTVLQKDNWHQMDQLVELGAELGFQDHVFALNLVDWGLAEWREQVQGVTMEDKFDENVAWRLTEKGDALGVRVRFWNVTQKYSTKNPASVCPWPFERSFVSSDSRVCPCCMIANPDVFEFTHDKSFSETWDSLEYGRFRQAHLDGEIPDVCKSCYEAPK
jgi:MoaA/NifB/PqqE/SkfB family radical SAM enzyme